MDANKEALIASLYDAALEPERWAETLLQLGRAFDGLGGQYFLWDSNSHLAPFSVMSGSPPGTGELYLQYYGGIDPKLEYSLKTPVGDWLICNEVFDERFVSRSEFYQDYFIPRGGRYLAGTRLLETDGKSALLGLFRAVGSAPFSTEDKIQLQALTPHMQRAARMQLRLAETASQARLLSALINALPDAVMAISESGHVKFMNRNAEMLVRMEGGPLRIRNGRIAAETLDGENLLRLKLGQAARAGIGGAIRLEARRGTEMRLHLTLCPLSVQLRFMQAEAEPLALVMISAPGQAAVPASTTLQALFDLTPAEARLALALMCGKALDEFAAEISVAISTVRSQLSSMLGKTGTRRQAELVALLRGVPLVPNDDKP